MQQAVAQRVFRVSEKLSRTARGQRLETTGEHSCAGSAPHATACYPSCVGSRFVFPTSALLDELKAHWRSVETRGLCLRARVQAASARRSDRSLTSLRGAAPCVRAASSKQSGCVSSRKPSKATERHRAAEGQATFKSARRQQAEAVKSVHINRKVVSEQKQQGVLGCEH